MKKVIYVLLFIISTYDSFGLTFDEICAINIHDYSKKRLKTTEEVNRVLEKGIFKNIRMLFEWSSIEKNASIYFDPNPRIPENLTILKNVNNDVPNFKNNDMVSTGDSISNSYLYFKLKDDYEEMKNQKIEFEVLIRKPIKNCDLIIEKIDNIEKINIDLNKEKIYNGNMINLKMQISNVNAKKENPWSFRIKLSNNEKLYLKKIILRKVYNINGIEVYDYNFESVDKMIDFCIQNKIDYLGGLAFSHRYHLKDPTIPPWREYEKNTPDLDAWKKYVLAFVTRYKNKIKYWQIWNEPNHKGFWPGTTEEFAEIYIEAAKIIKKNVPNAIVIFSGSANVKEDTLEYYNKIEKLGVFDVTDIFSHHVYRNYPEDITWINKYVNYLKSKNKSYVATEVGWSTYTKGVSEDLQAIDLIKNNIVLYSFGFEKVYNFELADYGNDKNDREHNFGLITYDGKPKKGLKLIEKEYEFFKGYKLYRYNNSLNQNIYFYILKKDNKYKGIIWSMNKVSIISKQLLEDKGEVFDIELNKISTSELIVLNSKPIYIDGIKKDFMEKARIGDVLQLNK